MTLARSPTCEKALDADVFIQIRPMNSLASTDQSPVLQLRGSGMRKPREPRKWSHDGSSVREIYGERIIAYRHAQR